MAPPTKGIDPLIAIVFIQSFQNESSFEFGVQLHHFVRLTSCIGDGNILCHHLLVIVTVI